MKKIIFVLLFVFVPFAVHAEGGVLDNKSDNFELIQGPIFALEDGSSVFVLNIIKGDSSKATSWTARSYCEDDMQLQFNLVGTNDCQKNVKLNFFAENMFFVLFRNETGELKDFSFKLKAYDEAGKWIHSEKKSFGWK